MSSEPQIRFLVPPNNEGNWSDLLAAMIETDPEPIKQILGINDEVAFQVVREWTVRWTDENDRNRTDRADIVLKSTKDDVLAVIEVKVLAPIGPNQLGRYAQSITARKYQIIQLRNFEVPITHPLWRTVTWEQVLQDYSSSVITWVAETARAWLVQMALLVPNIDGSVVWRDVRDGSAGDIDLRARGAWLHSQMANWCSIDFGFSHTDGGRSWVVEMEQATRLSDCSVAIEMDEGLPVKQWNGVEGAPPRAERLKGPTVLIGVLQREIESAHSFDWALISKLFTDHVLDNQGSPRDGRAWRKGSAQRSQLTDWVRYVRDSDRVPNWIGQGYNMSSKYNWCLFGARFDLSPDLTLKEVDSELRRTEGLIQTLAAAV